MSGRERAGVNSDNNVTKDVRTVRRDQGMTNAQPARSRAGTVGRATVRLFLIPAFIILIIYSPRYNEGRFLSLDEGQYLAPVAAVLDGKVLYREAYTFYGPVLVHGLALCMRLFGATIATYRAAFLWGSIVVLLLSYALLLSAVKRNAFAFLGGWMIALINGASYWYARYGAVRLCGPLLSALCFVGYFGNRNRRWLIGVAGALAALSAFTSPDMLYPALVVGIVGITISAVQERRLVMARLVKACGLYSLGFIAVLIPFVIWLASRGALIPYLQAGFYDVPFILSNLYPVGHVFTNPPASLSSLAWRTFLLTRACLMYVMLASYVCAAGYLAARWMRAGHLDVRDSSIAVALAIGVPMLHIGWRRLEGFQLFFGAPPAFVVLAYLWERLYEWMRLSVNQLKAKRRYDGARLVLALAPALVAFSVSFLWMAHYTVRRANLAVILQNYGLKELPQQLRCVPLELERAGIAVPEEQAERIKGVVEYIQAHTQPGEPIFALPHEGTIYFLADRPSPTRFSTVIYTEFRPEYMQEALNDLERTKPKLAVYAGDSYLNQYFKVTAEERITPLMEYLRTHYVEMDAIGDTHFYVRTETQRQP